MMNYKRSSIPERGAITLLILFVACNKSAPSDSKGIPAPNIRDSAGVHIVEYPTLGPTPMPDDAAPINPFVPQLRQIQPLRLEAKPFLTLGGSKNEDSVNEEFDSKGNPNVVALKSGTLVVSDISRLMYYDRSGKLLHSAGHVGQGPGEFRKIRSICALNGDQIMVTDFDGRVSLWNKNGEHIRTFARPNRRVSSDCEPHGFIATREIGSNPTAPDANELVPYSLNTADGQMIKRLGLHAIDERNGTPYFAFTESYFYFGNGREFTVERYDSNARLVGITRLLLQREPIAEASWRASRERSIPKGAPPEVAAVYRSDPKPPVDRWAAFSALHIDDDKRLWVSDYRALRGWTIFDSTGVIVCRFDTGYGVAGFGHDFVAVISRNADFAVSILFYRIIDGG